MTDHRQTETIDLDRVLFDPEYRRVVMAELKAQRRSEASPAASRSPQGERNGSPPPGKLAKRD